MIKLGQEAIQDIIRPCGLSPMKSKGIYGLSQIILEKYNGEVPFGLKHLNHFLL